MSQSFEFWLQNLCDTFSILTDSQQITTLESIIDICGPKQLCFLSHKTRNSGEKRLPQMLTFGAKFSRVEMVGSRHAVQMLSCK